MNISLELIDQMRKRTNCSYEEAKMYLEKYNGDIVEAIVDFEKSHTGGFSKKAQMNNHFANARKSMKKNKGGFKDFINKCYQTRVIVEGKEFGTVMNMSILFVALAVFSAFWIPLIGLGLILILGYKVKIRKATGIDVKVEQAFSEAADAITKTIKNEPQQPQQNNTQPKTDDDEAEITVD